MLSIILMVLFINIGVQMSSPVPHLGMVNEKLLKCGSKPNCVCSEYKDDTDHFIEPIILAQSSSAKAAKDLKEIIAEAGGELRIEKKSYLAATFSSAFFGFVDDLEFRIDFANDKIHIRSASRLGYSDLGVNRKRVQRIKELYRKKR